MVVVSATPCSVFSMPQGVLVHEVAVQDNGPATTFTAEIPEGAFVQMIRVGFKPDETEIVHIAEMHVFSPLGDPPAINFFTATGNTLQWSVTGADSIELIGSGMLPESGSLQVSPSVSTAHRLSAGNECETVYKSVGVEVNGPRTSKTGNWWRTFPSLICLTKVILLERQER